MVRLPRLPGLGSGPRRRSVLNVLAVLAIVGVVLIVRPGLQDHRSPMSGTPHPTPSTVEPSAPPHDDARVFVPRSTSRETADRIARPVAVNFVRAWARPDATSAAWFRGVAVYVEPSYAELLRFTDPARVPASRVVGGGRVVSVQPGVVVVDVPTDRGTCHVTVADVSGSGKWLVSTHSWVPAAAR